ncbi:hypothetical protein NDA16_003163 [Ustilago loliicola]|nr:hypothetical protein NDA16_003163 [Ustilago loliicola]
MASILPSSGPSSSSLAAQRNLAQRNLVPSSSSIKPALGSSKLQSARLAPASSSSTIASAPPSPTKLKSAPLAPVLPASPAPSSSSSNTTTSLAKKDSTGPLVQPSKEWVLPARAKPGRKPSETEPLTKRKAQNRASQRAFRERKQSYLAELEAKVAAYEAAEIDRSVEIQKVAQKLRAENEALRKEVGNWKEKFMQLERFLLQAKANGDGGHLSIGGGCGFCTEASPCVCADDFLDLSSAASSSQLSHIAVPNDVPSALPLPKRNPAATAHLYNTGHFTNATGDDEVWNSARSL